MKYARRWLYGKGIMVPQEERDPMDAQLDSFFDSVRTGKPPKADADAGLNCSTAVILANLAMDQSRRVQFSEFGALAKSKPAGR